MLRRAILFLFFSLMIFPLGRYGNTPDTSFVSNNHAISDFGGIQLLPDPNLSEAPSVKIEGTSGEFAYYHYSAGEMSYVNFTWTHVAGTSLEFPENYDPVLPECEEYIYLTQTLTWDYEIMPEDGMYNIEYSIELSGDFASEEYGDNMFRIYIWLIDSSNNWNRIYESYTPYEAGIQNDMFDFSYLDLQESWGGMVQDEFGVQEDPEDTLTIALGIAPTRYFRQLGAIIPWQEYNGQVVLTIYRVEVSVIADIMPAKYRESAMIEGIWSSTNIDRCTDMAIDEDGSVYVIGWTYSIDPPQPPTLILTKWDSYTNILWEQSWNGETNAVGNSIDVGPDGSVYTAGWYWGTVGRHEHLLMKWSSTGSLIWNQTFIDSEMNVGEAIAIANDNSIYSAGYRLWIENKTSKAGAPYLIKCDSNGNVLWKSNCTGATDELVIDLELASENNALVSTTKGIWMFNTEGVLLWNRTAQVYDSAIDQYDDIYVVYRNVTDIYLAKWDSNGVEEWNVIAPRCDFVGGITGLWQHMSITSSLNDTIYALAVSAQYQSYHVLAEYDSTGNQLWNKLISHDTYAPKVGLADVYSIEVSENGLLYIAGTDYRTESYGIVVAGYRVNGYTPYPASFGFLGDPISILALASLGVILVASAILARVHISKKKALSRSKRRKVGVIVRYNPENKVVRIKVLDDFSVGDRIWIEGKRKSISEVVESMSKEGIVVYFAKPGDEVEFKIEGHVSEQDDVLI